MSSGDARLLGCRTQLLILMPEPKRYTERWNVGTCKMYAICGQGYVAQTVVDPIKICSVQKHKCSVLPGTGNIVVAEEAEGMRG